MEKWWNCTAIGGNRTWIPGDKADDATEQTDAEKLKAGACGAGAMGCAAGLQSGALSDDKDGRTPERILAESVELLRIL